jgi:hypothetical protein
MVGKIKTANYGDWSNPGQDKIGALAKARKRQYTKQFDYIK